MPSGCAFGVAKRQEYQDWSYGSSVVSSTPALRRVRRGLGGNVATDAPGRADPSTTAAFAWESDEATLASEIAWGPGVVPSLWPASNRTSGVTWLTPAGLLHGMGPTRMHEVYLCGLEPATTYGYRVGGGPAGAETWSEVFTFTTTPSDPSTPVTLAINGDSRGEANDAWRLLQTRLSTLSPTLALFNGDAIGSGQDQTGWTQWLDHASADAEGHPLTLASQLTLTAHGNHDAHSSLYFGHMTLPQDVTAYPKYAELFYSVDIGPVHAIVIDDAWVVNTTGDPKYAKILGDWLEADLVRAEKNRAKVPWIVATHHHAEYSSSTHGKDADVLRGRAFFTPIWDAHHVNLLVVSHDHDYERTKPLTGPAASPTIHASSAEGTVYVVCAGAGAPAYKAGTSAFTETSHAYGSAAGGAVGLYAIVEATATELSVHAHELRADGSDPVIDQFALTK